MDFCLKSLETRSEFDEISLLPGVNPVIDAFGSASDFETSLPKITRKIEQRVADIVRPLVLDVLQKNSTNANPTLKTMRDLALKSGDVQFTQYFRAGKNYIRIGHEMGNVGNLFFKVVFDSILGTGKYCLLEQKNSICIVCRI